MRISKHVLIGLMSLVVVCGALGLVLPPQSQALEFLKKKAFPQAGPIKKFFEKTVCGFRDPGQRFVTSKDGTEVCDRTTGDIWEQDPNRGPMTQPLAIAFCAALDKGQGQHYELASVQQLVSVLDYTQSNPALTPDVFSNVESNFYWSASELAGFPAGAWFVLFNDGDVITNLKGDTKHAWCVRRDKDVHAH